MIQNDNFSFHNKVELQEIECDDEEVFDSCNFTQDEPGTKVAFSGKKITIQNSNCTNCVFEEDVTVDNCNIHQTEKSISVLSEERRIEEEKNLPEAVYTETELKEMMVSVGVHEATIATCIELKGKNIKPAPSEIAPVEESPIEELPVEEEITLKGKV